MAPSIVILTCMEIRSDPLRMLGLPLGGAHTVQNAGGRASDDAIRSILDSQQLLGTLEVIVVHHTDCVLAKTSNETLRERVDRGLDADISGVDFLPLGRDLIASTREDVARLRASPGLAPSTTIRGYLYDARTGTLSPVE